MGFMDVLSGAASGFVSGGPWGALAGGVLGMFAGDSGAGQMSPEQARRMADPYADYRAGAAAKLDALMANPNSVTNLPGYQFLAQQGTQGVERAMSARGYSMSGNEMLALQQQNQGLANQMYNSEFDKLAMLSGANSSPSAGGTAGIQQNQQNRADLFNTIGMSGKAMGQGISALSDLFSNNSGGGGTGSSVMATPSISPQPYSYNSIPGLQ